MGLAFVRDLLLPQVQFVINALHVVSNPSLVINTTLTKLFFHSHLHISSMPCKSRNDNISFEVFFAKSVAQRFELAKN